MTELLTLPEVAARLRVSLRTVHRLTASGQLRILKIRNRTFIKDSEVEAYLSAAHRRAA